MANINRTFALVVGIIFTLVGLLGFIPALVPGGNELGIFAVNILHSIVHLLIGVLGIAAAYTGFSKLYNQVIGVVYLLLAILGFIPALVFNGLLIGLVSINLADNLLHLVVGIAAIYVGFFIASTATASRA